uniref:Uncharacterized protein n=1 Tax=Meloidogyne javanica TaxID=6303 RepID=A0A915M9Y5_MELJA
MFQSKHQNKKLPMELLSDIFKAVDCNNPKMCMNSKSVDECQKLWGSRIIAFLTSSSIVYLFAVKSFKGKLETIFEFGKIIKETERSTTELMETFKNQMLKLKQRVASLDENTRLLEKTTKILKRLRAEIEERGKEEDAPIAKRTRSHSTKE